MRILKWFISETVYKRYDLLLSKVTETTPQEKKRYTQGFKSCVAVTNFYFFNIKEHERSYIRGNILKSKLQRALLVYGHRKDSYLCN